MTRIIDLSLTLATTLRGVAIRTAKRLETEGWNATTLELYSHCGTHVDAPRHFLPDGRAIDEIPLERCVGPAFVADLTPVEPRELITAERLAAWDSRIGPGARVLLRTDWHRTAGADAYRNQLPRIDIGLARLFAEREIALLGVEPPSVADVNDREELTRIHRVLLGAGIVIVEGLANLDRLGAEDVFLVALPLKVGGGDGSPARVVALEGLT